MPKRKRPIKANLRVVKEVFGDIPKQEAFQKAFEPYFSVSAKQTTPSKRKG
ncbi:hypothetical protein AB1K91_17645 [Terribacillus sp. 179-K 1B1 HS]|uniref:hypothetical protein n=1 Tax=Terribacillus sp. 179-K 1B1 HS TaxID=3142388 RepID=UPI0039A3B766